MKRPIPRRSLATFPEHLLEVVAFLQTLRRGKRFTSDGVQRQPRTQALSLARPLARRALMTARPPRVRMRARKPCVRFLLISLGWNVRFMWVTLSEPIR